MGDALAFRCRRAVSTSQKPVTYAAVFTGAEEDGQETQFLATNWGISGYGETRRCRCWRPRTVFLLVAALASVMPLLAGLVVFRGIDGSSTAGRMGRGSAGPKGTWGPMVFASAFGSETSSFKGATLRSWKDAWAKAREVEQNLTSEERVGLLHGGGFLVDAWVGFVKAVPRLGIPALRLQDSSAGFRPTGPDEFGTTTSWPSSLCLAASWNEDLVSHVATAIGREFRGKGANVILGPGINVHRTPYGGRNFEYLSGEDPYLGSRLAAAYVKAVQAQGVMAVAKHFAFNEQETERTSMNSEVGEHVAWALYYPPFQAAIDAGVGAIMCSYNKVNGTHACSNERLLHGDLKGAMGFNGFVMSDWYATHHSAAVENGLDMEQPDPKHFNYKKFADTDPEPVSQAARRVLASIYRLRLDEQPGCELPCKSERRTSQRTPEHLALAGAAAAAGVVLLKNDGILPLRAGHISKVAIIGAAADAHDTLNTWGTGSPYSGGGSGHVAAPKVSTPLKALQERAAAAGIHTLNDDSDLDLANRSQVLMFVEQADVIIIVAATTSTEDKDRSTLSLDDGVDELIEEVSKQRPTIVLIEAPGAVLTPWRDKTFAIACMFLGGEKTGSAWARVLFGDVEPSGRLPIALPARDTDEIRPAVGSVPYSEGLMTSYRSPSHRPAFPFGHGLTYTTFSFGKPTQSLDNCPKAACIHISVSNVGKRAGSEVVQAYLQFDPKLKEPRMVLRGFRRTSLLQPGESEKVRIILSHHDLSTYIVGQGWRPQEWAVAHIGASSGDIRRVLPVRAALPIPLN